jgi:hypothetical protein
MKDLIAQLRVRDNRLEDLEGKHWDTELKAYSEELASLAPAIYKYIEKLEALADAARDWRANINEPLHILANKEQAVFAALATLETP